MRAKFFWAFQKIENLFMEEKKLSFCESVLLVDQLMIYILFYTRKNFEQNEIVWENEIRDLKS